MHNLRLGGLTCLLMMVACGGDSSRSIDEDIDELTALANQRARTACGAPDDIEISDPEGDTEAGRCYYELAFEFDPCERETLRLDPETAREVLECSLHDLDATVDVCCSDGKCTYGELDACEGTNQEDATCDAAWARFAANHSDDCAPRR